MDDLANAYWTVLSIFILLLFSVAIIIILGVINIIKVKTKKKIKLKSNLITVGLAYLVLATVFYFNKDYGKVFSFFFLPILSIFVLIILEVAGLFINKKENRSS